MRRFIAFFSVAFVFLGSAGYYLGHRVIGGSEILGQHPVATWSAVIAFMGLVLIGPMLSRILPEHMHGRFYVFRWSVNMTMAVFFAWLFYTLVTDLSIYLLSFVAANDVVAGLQSWSLLIIAALVVLTFVIGALQALSPKIYHVDVPIAGLPTEFSGFKIAQISDLHIGEMIGRRYVQAVVEKTNSLRPDIVAMTGDIIDGNSVQTAPIAEGLADLKANDGVFYVTGNHEYYWGVQNALRQITQAGARILMNENVRIRRGDAEIAVAGLPDISAGSISSHRSDPKKSIADLPREMIKILLAHQPVVYRTILGLGFHLQLSGHTHGGQFFPWSLMVRLFQRYNQGLVRHDDLWIYVNRGTATWGPRLRFGIPPEITLLTLRPS